MGTSETPSPARGNAQRRRTCGGRLDRDSVQGPQRSRPGGPGDPAAGRDRRRTARLLPQPAGAVARGRAHRHRRTAHERPRRPLRHPDPDGRRRRVRRGSGQRLPLRRARRQDPRAVPPQGPAQPSGRRHHRGGPADRPAAVARSGHPGAGRLRLRAVRQPARPLAHARQPRGRADRRRAPRRLRPHPHRPHHR